MLNTCDEAGVISDKIVTIARVRKKKKKTPFKRGQENELAFVRMASTSQALGKLTNFELINTGLFENGPGDSIPPVTVKLHNVTKRGEDPRASTQAVTTR
jgi:hypothetical protein